MKKLAAAVAILLIFAAAALCAAAGNFIASRDREPFHTQLPLGEKDISRKRRLLQHQGRGRKGRTSAM